jgi:hypothetical protein
MSVMDYRAGAYFERLEKFLGTPEIDRRLTKINHQLASSSGLYLNYWVLPRTAWWRGFEEAREVIKKKWFISPKCNKGNGIPIADGCQTFLAPSDVIRGKGQRSS